MFIIGCVIIIGLEILAMMFMHGATRNNNREVSDFEQMKYLQKYSKRRRCFGNRKG